ncbi:MAG: hypothetical protein NTU47_04210 [Ignavibacteriales bacterium]|nr:hypothetical protein [Ignavibacteriales bacterium]
MDKILSFFKLNFPLLSLATRLVIGFGAAYLNLVHGWMFAQHPFFGAFFSFLLGYVIPLVFLFEIDRIRWADADKILKNLRALSFLNTVQMLELIGQSTDHPKFFRKLLEREQVTFLEKLQKARDLIIRVEDHKFEETNMIVELCRDNKDSVFRYTWQIDRSEPLFGDVMWDDFFRKISDANDDGIKGIAKVEVILVLEDDVNPGCPAMQSLLDYYSSRSGKGMTVKYIFKKDYDRFIEPSGFSSGPPFYEFGLYGGLVLFGLEDYVKHISRRNPGPGKYKSIGVFSGKPEEFRQYMAFFVRLWDNSVAPTSKGSPTGATQDVKALIECLSNVPVV